MIGPGCFARKWDVLSGVAEIAWDVLSGVPEMELDVMSGVTKTAWDVCPRWQIFVGMFCPGSQKMAWDVLSGSVQVTSKLSPEINFITKHILLLKEFHQLL